MRLLTVLACAVVAGCGLARPPGSSPPTPARPLLLTFWCGPPLAEFDDQRAAEIAAAGFTIVGAPCSGGFDPGLNLRALDVGQRHGLHLWVGDQRFSPDTVLAPDWPQSLDAAVAEYRDHPALAGYFVGDEPTAPAFDQVAAVVAALRAVDPSHLAYVNLLPDYVPPRALGAPSYEDYVDQFIATVRPQLLSYDYYPFGKEKDRSTFFTNLGSIRSAALRHDLPFMLIVLATPHGPYRAPTEGELAWQVHLALAYGASGISYFTYWTPPSDAHWEFHDGLIDDGRPTARYFQVARLNRELRALAGALERFSSIGVADSLGEIGVPFPIGPIDAIAGGPITAGLFGNGEGGLAVLLVNRDYQFGTTAWLQLRPGAALPDLFDPDTASWQSGAPLSIVLPPGGARLLRWGESRSSDRSAVAPAVRA